MKEKSLFSKWFLHFNRIKKTNLLTDNVLFNMFYHYNVMFVLFRKSNGIIALSNVLYNKSVLRKYDNSVMFNVKWFCKLSKKNTILKIVFKQFFSTVEVYWYNGYRKNNPDCNRNTTKIIPPSEIKWRRKGWFNLRVFVLAGVWKPAAIRSCNMRYSLPSSWLAAYTVGRKSATAGHSDTSRGPNWV